MAFKKKSARKLPKSNTPIANPVRPMSIEAMVIATDGGGKCYFKRLKYKGCPLVLGGRDPLKSEKFCPSEQLVDMQRDEIIRELYELIREWPANRTTKGYFDSLCKYTAALDAVGRPLNFSANNVMWYGGELQRLIKLSKAQGGIKPATANSRKQAIRAILRAKGEHLLIKQMPKFARESTPFQTLDDDGFTRIGRFLNRGYQGYMAHLLAGTSPTICPMHDHSRLLELKLNKRQLGNEVNAAKKRVAPLQGDWRNQLVRLALLLTHMLTGINPTPLYHLRRCDVRFKKGAGDCYYIETIKNRAGGQRQDNELGFTKFSKDFFENWLSATEKWSDDPKAPVFPLFLQSKLVAWGTNGKPPQTTINKVLLRYGLPKISASVFRKTRSAQLMRVLNDVYEVADANNNSIQITARDYLYGVQEQHDLVNAGAMEALVKLARGMDKQQVLAEAAWQCKDPLTELEYLKYRHKRPNKTRTGLGCEQPLVDKVAKQRTKYRHINPDLNLCIDFLDCFDCPAHGLVAEVDDIWMMLSFRDTLREVLQRPAYNSYPSEKFSVTENKTELILEKLRAKAPGAYNEAEKMNREAPHPLYSDDEAIDDLMRIYG
ncbi:hypothetical protein [Shewanella sp. KCT]|nr:hypothetical protein [Shewanella sp. KCT]TVP14809.1 hypothetical protein AYI87_07385 [Shewanella sp. KCT]